MTNQTENMASLIARNTLTAARARMLRSQGRPVRPRLVTFNVTDRCNARCEMCAIHTRKSKSKELNIDEIDSVFSDPVMSRLEVLRLTGGEPFLRKDLLEIAETALRRAPIRILYVTTNGLLPERVEAFARDIELGRAGLHLQVSLDALDGRHDHIRGVPGARDAALETLERLAALARPGLHFGINQTVLADTLDCVGPLSGLAERLGAGHSVILGARHHEGKDMSGMSLNGNPLPFETEQPLTREQAELFYRMADRRAAAVSQAPSAMLRALSEAYLNQGGRNRLLFNKYDPAPPCMAMFAHFRLLPNGDVVACSVLAANPAGNVRQTPIGEIWNSAKELRKRVRDCPGCWIECDIQPSIFYSGDIIPWTLKNKEIIDRLRK
jgi:MoaA/NifB/PqqE/SkfB family radical SAM enzyme